MVYHSKVINFAYYQQIVEEGRNRKDISLSIKRKRME